MSLKQDILSAQKEAMKARNTDTLSVLRLLGSAIKNKEIEIGAELSDEQVQAVVKTFLKQSKDALKEFEAAGREDLQAQAKQEIAILSQYLPPQMDDAQLETVIQEVIADCGNGANMGMIMGKAMQAVNGQADGNRVRDWVTRLLA